MDETRIRAVIREEIALAVKTLGQIADLRNSRDDSPGSDALYEIDGVASNFQEYSYAGACEEADEQRAQDAANPFAEPEGEAVAVEVKALVRAEVLDVLKEMRSAFYMSGTGVDYSVAERLDGVITEREIAAGE